MTPANELATAASKLRKLIGSATNGPWETTWRGQQHHLDGYRDGDLHPISEWTYAIATWEPQASEQRAECDTADAAYIAAMHPGVGAALADSLDSAAELAASYPDLARDHDRTACDDYACDLMGRSLALARAINAAA